MYVKTFSEALASLLIYPKYTIPVEFMIILKDHTIYYTACPDIYLTLVPSKHPQIGIVIRGKCTFGRRPKAQPQEKLLTSALNHRNITIAFWTRAIYHHQPLLACFSV